MPTKIMKWLAIAAMLVALAWRSSPGYRLVVGYVVTVCAIAVLTQAARARKYVWFFVFLTIAVLVNPLLTSELSYRMAFWLDLASLGAFTISLWALKTQPVLSIASITDRTPGSESL